MRLSVDRLRWVLIAGAAALLLVVVSFVGYGRWKALKTFRTLMKHSGATITHETNGFTYSQTVKGRTVSTLHAAKAIQHSNGTWTLHDAELTLFGKSGERTDHIYGAEFEYDPDAGVARALGQVHMDLQAPEDKDAKAEQPHGIRGKEGRSPSALRDARDEMRTVHVVTSGLVYLRKLGVAATQEDVQFSFGQMVAHAHGAEFDESDSLVHLLADVHVDGDLRGRTVHLQAVKADLDRNHQVATLQQPVLNSEGRQMRSSQAVVRLRSNGSVDSILATGGVTMTAGTQTLRSAAFELLMNENEDPRMAHLTGGVTLLDTSAVRPMQGAAQSADLSFDAEGQARELTAVGGARLETKEKELKRSIAGDRVVVELVAEHAGSKQAKVSSVHAVGHAVATAESMVQATHVRRQSVLQAADLRAEFTNGDKTLAKQVVGTGDATLDQTASNGESQHSSADSVTMLFGADGQIVNALEVGHVKLRSVSLNKQGQKSLSTGSSERAVYEAASETLHLTGNAMVTQEQTQLSAREVILRGQADDAEASGGVVATMMPQAPSAGATASSRESSHVIADHVAMSRGGQFAVFTGTDAHPARLWQEGSQLQAAVLTMDGRGHTLLARPAAPSGRVVAIFAHQEASPSGAGKEKSKAKAAPTAQATRLTSAALDYSDLRGEAVFTGGVTMMAGGGEVKSDHATVFFTGKPQGSPKATGLGTATPAARTLDHAVMSGNVRLTQPGRTGTAEQLLYTASTGSFVLTGSPAHRPRVADAQQGNVVGTTLLFSTADSTIVVAGEGKGNNRVRTEVGLEPEASHGSR